MRYAHLFVVGFLLPAVSPAQQASSFVNFETAPVHPLAISPEGRTLAVCNLPDNRVELFHLVGSVPAPIGDVPVGVDPVSLRFRTTNELWVLNHISRTINIVDATTRLVMDTIATLDGPADIQFAGSPARAFVSCAKENTVQVFDVLTRQVVTNLVINGERPKAMALSPDRTKLYVAIFESGNGSTILVGTGTNTTSVLKHPSGPYGGQFPVPNDGTNLRPALNTNAYQYEQLLPDSLIVKKNAAGRWIDDNHGDWTEFISGTNAALSGRIRGWDLPDWDLAVIDVATLAVSYVTGLMNICMDVAVNPASGRVAVIGTDGLNERRFEPNLRGTFLRVNLALVDPATSTKTILDLNPHLDYSTSSLPQSVRDLSIGDPRGIVWNSAGTRGYVTGMGSRNLIVIDAAGQRVGPAPIELAEGPSGLALDEPRQRLYVLNRFSATLSVLDSVNLNVLTNLPFFDPTPSIIKAGRKHLYDTRRNSGLGQVACASCHPDARFDRLAWDLGNPAFDLANRPEDGSTFHPMKGPLVTQTLQDIIEADDPNQGHPIPLHWRGDRANIESFNVTFTDLLARETPLTTNEMQEFKNFLATIHFPPSRFRNFENSMPSYLPLPGFFGVNSNGVPDRTPLPTGRAYAGFLSFFNTNFNGRFPLTMGTCTTCHNRQSGLGFEGDIELVERDGGRRFKAAQLRSIADKLGMDLLSTNSRAGFGFRFDGRADTLTTLLSDVFAVTDNQAIADLTAFLLAFPGSGIRLDGQGFAIRNDSQDSHGAVGKQSTLFTPQAPEFVQPILYPEIIDKPLPEIVVRGWKDGLNRGWHYAYNRYSSGGGFQSDRNQEQSTFSELLALASPDTPLTITVVPPGTGRRLGVDRDEDGSLDRTEIDYGFDPADSRSIGNTPPRFQPPDPFAWPGYLPPEWPLPLATLLGVTDPDVPGQTLTFSLVGNTPAWVSINPTTGVFSWTPPPEEGEFSGFYTLRVTDNGVPPLSAETVFGIVHRPLRVFSVERNLSSGVILIAFYSMGDRKYRLQFKDRLEDAAWSDLPDIVTSPPFEAILSDPTATNAAQRFYRVVLVE